MICRLAKEDSPSGLIADATSLREGSNGKKTRRPRAAVASNRKSKRKAQITMEKRRKEGRRVQGSGSQPSSGTQPLHSPQFSTFPHGNHMIHPYVGMHSAEIIVVQTRGIPSQELSYFFFRCVKQMLANAKSRIHRTSVTGWCGASDGS